MQQTDRFDEIFEMLSLAKLATWNKTEVMISPRTIEDLMWLLKQAQRMELALLKLGASASSEVRAEIEAVLRGQALGEIRKEPKTSQAPPKSKEVSL